MEKTLLQNKRITELIADDHTRAQVLYYFGIRFYDYPYQTLEEACVQLGLKVAPLVKELESPGGNFQDEGIPLYSYPIDLIVEYLKHSHYFYVKHKLPFVGKLVENFRAEHADYQQVEKDLKVLYPLFFEDFVHHIYQEEDTLFKYINTLQRAQKGHYHPSKLYRLMEKQSLQRCALEHEANDDEMTGIRKITNDYYLTSNAPLHIKVIYTELVNFEKSLQTHARIENQILFPKAMALENEVKQMFYSKAQWN
ncbi:MAG: iron-sulfur cluster repair di-iron protein [Cytophagales bacterium]